MRTLRKGLGGKDVKILQGLLIIHGYDISVGYTFNDKTLDVVKQVEKLIKQATSHENLSQSYLGWCPFW